MNLLFAYSFVQKQILGTENLELFSSVAVSSLPISLAHYICLDFHFFKFKKSSIVFYLHNYLLFQDFKFIYKILLMKLDYVS